MRWKLLAFRDWLLGLRGRFQRNVEQANYEHKLCPNCGKVNDRENTDCYGCETSLPSQKAQFLSRLAGLGTQRFGAVGILSLVMVLVYGRMAQVGLQPFEISGPLGWAMGAFDPELVKAGEVSRLVRSLFIHWSLVDLGFHLVALFFVVPKIEGVTGRGRTLGFFLGFGVATNLTLARLGLPAIAGGSTGSIYALMGFGMAWGHRVLAFEGRVLRDELMRVALFWVALNYFLGGGAFAPVVALAWGAFFGFGMPETWGERRAADKVDIALGAISSVLLLYVVGAAFTTGAPPPPVLP